VKKPRPVPDTVDKSLADIQNVVGLQFVRFLATTHLYDGKNKNLIVIVGSNNQGAATVNMCNRR
jgi:hypothetical protein